MKNIISCRGRELEHLFTPNKQYLIGIMMSAEVFDFKKHYCLTIYPQVKSAGAYSFIISDISEKSKISRGYCNCTGVIATGKDSVTGKNISFISHQEPSNIFGAFMLPFRISFQSTLNSLVERSVLGSIEVVYFGGEISKEPMVYRRMTEYINRLVFDTCGVSMVVVVEPKNGDYVQDSAVYDTNQRRLYVSSC